MQTNFVFVAGVLASLAFLGCSSSDGSSGEIDANEARTKAAALAPDAKIESVEKLDEGAEHRWKVSATLPNGAPLTLEFERSTGELAELEGERGPFDYGLPSPRRPAS
jgi:hypothetical protein